VSAAVPDPPPTLRPSLVELIRSDVLDAELAALVWVLVEGSVPLLVAGPAERLGAAAQLVRGIIGSIRPELDDVDLGQPLSRVAAGRLTRGQRPGGVVPGTSLEDVHLRLAAPPLPMSDEEMTFLGCILVLGPATGTPSPGPLRVVAAHYARPLARDAHGHRQLLPPAVLATWDAPTGRYEHFSWGVLPEIAARLGRKAGDLEADLHHRRDDLAGLAKAGVTSLDEVRRLIAGYRVRYGESRDAHAALDASEGHAGHDGEAGHDAHGPHHSNGGPEHRAH
jgi:hypothetical protein